MSTEQDHSIDSELHDEKKSTNECRLLIENAHVGGIIGKAGANIKQVREQSGAFVSILKTDFRNVQDRVMVMKGEIAQIAAAIKMCAELILESTNSRDSKKEKDEKDKTTNESSTAVKLLVHRSAVGAIIGKSGSVIKDTQTDTGARVQVANEPLPNSTEKTVTLTGTPEQIHAACTRILNQLAESPLRAGTKSYPYVPGAPVYQNFGNSHNYQNPVLPIYAGPYSANAPTSTQKIAIPTVCAGCVIGKGGQVIRDLRTQSGANISIADPDPASPNERVVTLTGSPQGIQTAVYLIRQLVEQYNPPSESY